MSGKPSVVKPAKSPYGVREKRSMEALLGKPVCAAPSRPETRAQRVMQLGQRARVLARGNPYQASFYKFLTELVYTQDEARAGEVRRFPDHPYILDLCDDLAIERLQVWDKARRVLASWVVCAWDLWLIGGGQDPRWVSRSGEPILMKSTENRRIVIAAQKLEDLHGSAWFLNERIKVIYDEFERRGFRETHWPSFPRIEFRFSEARATNGGHINCVPSGSDQMRGTGATLIHAEEIAFWTKARTAIMGALPALMGGGHIVCLTTANAESWADDLVHDRIDP